MNTHIGPHSKEKFRQENLAKLGKYKALFWVIFLVGPLTLFALNKFHLIKPWDIRNNGQGSVALVIAEVREVPSMLVLQRGLPPNMSFEICLEAME